MASKTGKSGIERFFQYVQETQRSIEAAFMENHRQRGSQMGFVPFNVYIYAPLPLALILRHRE